MVLKKRRITKKSVAADRKFFDVKGRKILECSTCFDPQYNIGMDVKSIICPSCVQKLVAPPDIYVKNQPKEVRPRGWWLRKEYLSPSGVVYRYGTEVTDDEFTTEDVAEVAEKPARTRKKRTSTTKRRTAKASGKGRRDTKKSGKPGRKKS